MCTLVLLRRPGHRWPLLLAANRDEMNNRPWQAPGRHWPDRGNVVAGRDSLGGGTWLGLNDEGVIAAVLNRINTLGPAPGLRSRGELPLEALDHADATDAADALAHIDPRAYRPFNLVIADHADAFWISARAGLAGAVAAAESVEVMTLPPGLTMITAYDRNDPTSPRIRHFLPQFERAAAPDPETGDWAAWTDLLAVRTGEPGAGPGGAMTIATPSGFGTVSSSLLALPDPAEGGLRRRRSPLWLFAAGPPDIAAWQPIASLGTSLAAVVG
ncbi:MAG: NRDE family protein [Rhodospirillales bacterium]